MIVSLRQYLRKKADGIEGEIPQLIHMLKKSFTAKSFRMFWTHWNPIYSYYLGFYVYRPLKKWMPNGFARTLTFVLNGIFHDLIVSLLLRRFSYYVTLLFLVYGLIQVIEENINVSLNTKITRVIYNFILLLLPFSLIILLSNT